MGLIDELKKLARPYEEDDDYDEEDEEEENEDYDDGPRNVRRVSRDEYAPRSSSVRDTSRDREPIPRSSSYRENSYRESSYRDTGRETAPRPSYQDSYAPSAPVRSPGVDKDKVVNINTTTQLQVVLVKPEKFENASDIADHLRDKRTVVLNLESTNKDIARRLVDFLSGVAYAQEGKIKKISAATYIITPYNVDIIGDLIDELENNGLYF